MRDRRHPFVGKNPAGPGDNHVAPGDDAQPAAENGQGAPGDGESVTARIRALEEERERLRDEVKTEHDRFIRERADLENFKKRAAREREETLRYGTEGFVRDLLPVVDNLERALEAAGSSGQVGALSEGVRMVLDSLRGVMERHGVNQIQALGEPFDPARHEAMEQIESDEHQPNTVIREHQRGYMLHDRLVRASLVAVSKPGAGAKPASEPKPGSGPKPDESGS